MRILHAAAELYPLVKTGGLGDVVASLPAALAAQGEDVRLLLPGFPGFMAGIEDLRTVGALPAPAWAGDAVLQLGRVPGSGLPAYVVHAPALYDRPGHVYQSPDGRDWPDNHRRFALLGMAAAQVAGGLDGDWRPQVVHAHDWHAALAPVYVAHHGHAAATVLTIHNLAFQGQFPSFAFPDLGLPISLFAMDGLEYWGRVSFMKGGILFADRVTTVSPTYAAEIVTPEEGMGLDGVLRSRGAALSGILNGVDYRIWDPGEDALTSARYGPADLSGKAACKAALQREMGLAADPDALLLGAVTRLTGQKGFNLVMEAAPALGALGCQIALLGSGEPGLEDGFARLARSDGSRFAVRIGYDEALAHRIVAGADAILVPSRFEPCGLTQLYAMRYGTLPIVRRTGGLADTVTDAGEGGAGTGFVFDAVDGDAFLGAATRAVLRHRDADRWTATMLSAMAADFSWSRAADRYAALYREIVPGE